MCAKRFSLASLLVLFCCDSISYAAEATATKEAKTKKPVVLKVGDAAPKFAGVTDRGKKWKSEDHVGKKILVVYFYPADMTGGCTKQACSYRDLIKTMVQEGSQDELPIEVIGVSGDSVENHKHFREEYKLNFTLLADPKGEIAKAFGVRMGKGGTVNWQLDGMPIELVRGVTTGRWTFVIGPDKRIAYKNEKVKPAKDAAQVMKVVAGL
ncbi:MAG: peroxiredoxin, partial [Lacipirellulaceae bacterium]